MNGLYEKIEKIKNALINGYGESAAIILDAQLSGGTGGEVLMIVCSKLLGLKQRNREAYSVIENDAEDLIADANSIGLEPRPS